MNRLRTIVTASAAALSLTSLATPAVAASDTASYRDPAGDVHIYHHQGLSHAQRISIDARDVVVRQIDDGTIRFSVKLRRLIRTDAFDQMVFFNLDPAAGSNEQWTAQVGFANQDAASGYASWISSVDYHDIGSCDGLHAHQAPRKSTLFLDVPRRCVPGTPAKITFTTMAGKFRSDETPYSRDRGRIPGAHDVKD